MPAATSARLVSNLRLARSSRRANDIMTNMRGWSRIALPAALGMAHVALPVATFALSYSRPKDWSTHNVFRVILFAEAGMLCVWAGLGTRPWRQRLVGTLAGLAVCWLLLWLRETRQTAEMLVRSLLFPGAASVVLAVFIKMSHPAEAADRRKSQSRWQFSVRQLLVFTSTVAVVIVFVQHALRGALVSNERLVVAEGAQISVVIMVWAALGKRWRKTRLAAAALVVCGVGLDVQSFMSDEWFWRALDQLPFTPATVLWEDVLSIPLATLCEAALAAATVIVAQSAPRFSRTLLRMGRVGDFGGTV